MPPPVPPNPPRRAIPAAGFHTPSAASDSSAGGPVPTHTPTNPGQDPGTVEMPATLGGYQIVRRLGKGGMGVVYEGFDKHLDRRVAIKVMLAGLANDDECKKRFLREARAMAAVRHENVVAVYASGEQSGLTYIVMEMLEGEPLYDRISDPDRPAMPIPEAVAIVRQVAKALAAAHEKNLIHRDVKPSNIWLEYNRDGTIRRVVLLDFGLTRGTIADGLQTQTNAILGTPAYMSPEQARGSKVDPRTDLFSLGGVLYQMVTGEMPFASISATEMMIRAATEPHRPARTVNPQVPAGLSTIIDRLLAKDPNGRPASAEATARELKPYMTSAGRNPPPAERLPLPPKAKPLPKRAERSEPVPVAPRRPRAQPTADEFIPLHLAPPSAPPRRRRSKWRGRLLMLLALAAVAGVGYLYWQFFPTGETAVPTKKTVPTDPAVRAAGEKAAARWVMEQGGDVYAAGRPDSRVKPTELDALPGFVLEEARITDGPSVTDANLDALATAFDVKVLFLRKTKLTDAGLAKLADMPLANTVTWLELDYSAVGDDGIRHLAKFRRLESVDLRHTKITAAGLRHLSGLPRLVSVAVQRTGVTKADALPFVEANPTVGVITDEGFVAGRSYVTPKKSLP